MSALLSLGRGVAKSYLYTHVLKDVTRFLRRNLNEMDFDREHLLHRAGLTSYRPGGNLLLLAAGAAAGALAALALAPKPGAELRSEVKDRAMTFFSRADSKGKESARSLS